MKNWSKNASVCERCLNTTRQKRAYTARIQSLSSDQSVHFADKSSFAMNGAQRRTSAAIAEKTMVTGVFYVKSVR